MLEEGKADMLLKDLISLGLRETQIQVDTEIFEGSEGWFAPTGVGLHEIIPQMYLR